MIKEEMLDLLDKVQKHCYLFYHIYTKMSRRIKIYIFFLIKEKTKNESFSSDRNNDFFQTD